MPKPKHDSSAICESFVRDVLSRFTYLVREFGFEYSETRIDGHECMITFRKSKQVAVTVARNAGDLPWVMLTGNTGTPARYRLEEVPLDTLMAQRCPDEMRAMPEGFPVGEDVVRDVLTYYAGALRACAKDVLGGDLTAFDELRGAVNSEYARRTLAMKKEEDAAARPRHRRRKRK